MACVLPKSPTLEMKMSLDKLKAMAAEWAHKWDPPHTVALYGAMGAGKTTFVRFVIEALAGQSCEVISPTFPIVQVYSTPKGCVWHADLYRLKTLQEVEETGLIEAMYCHLCLIEWPQLVEPILCDLPHTCLTLGNETA